MDKEPKMMKCTCYAFALALLTLSTAAGADARSDYYQRAATRDMASFHAFDSNHDNTVTRTDIGGDVDFGPRFNDMDINRDGIVTLEEMQRYIQQQYGVPPAAGQKQVQAS
ncbi:MAG: EF-hand domain-containing protein [Pseudomonadota bacterium]|nr:EF-hand domain-containing protein [Pseudomonadota bacterium]